MEANGVAGLVAAIVIAFLIKVFNIVTEWLSKALDVEPPAPIPSTVDRSGLGAVRSAKTPEAPSTAAPEHPESPSQHP